MFIQVIASGSRGNAYRISDGVTPLLLECGVKYKTIQETIGFEVSKLGGCLITHEHKDHSYSVKQLLKSSVKCYMTKGTFTAMEDDINRFKHNVKIVVPQQPFRINSWTILPLETEHDAIEPVAYLMANKSGEKLLYASDTHYLRYRFDDLERGIKNTITHLMIECNYSEEMLKNNVESGKIPIKLQERIITSHFSLRHLKEFLAANTWDKLEEIHLVHLSDQNGDEELFRREISQLTGVPVYVA